MRWERFFALAFYIFHQEFLLAEVEQAWELVVQSPVHTCLVQIIATHLKIDEN